jgi:hypothetical protein
MNIAECFEYYEETGNTQYQIFTHTDGEWYLMQLSYDGKYEFWNIDYPDVKVTSVIFDELESSDQWCAI